MAVRKTVTQQAEEHLLSLVAQGVLHPGQPLRVEALCAQYGFTYTPLREAMRSLAAQGLLEYATNRGYRLPEVKADELVALYQIREALEGMAARLLAGRISRAQLSELDALACERDAASESNQGGTSSAINADMQFHRLVAEWCGNAFLPKCLLAPNILVRSIVRPSSFGDVDRALETGHRPIVEALADGDPERAEAAMRAHIREACRNALTA